MERGGTRAGEGEERFPLPFGERGSHQPGGEGVGIPGIPFRGGFAGNARLTGRGAGGVDRARGMGGGDGLRGRGCCRPPVRGLFL